MNMNTITFGAKNINGYSHKLVVCDYTHQYEVGQVCVNSTFVDVLVKKSDLKTIENKLISDGYTRTDEEFGKE